MFEPTGSSPEGRSLPPVVERIETQTEENPAPICVLVVGMAGSGKTTLMSALQESTYPKEEDEGEGEDSKPAATESSPSSMPAYCINLDPATLEVPYNASIDIRDTVKYKVRTIELKYFAFSGVASTKTKSVLTPCAFICFLIDRRKSWHNTILVQMEQS
jgi:GTPase SAR1 family protein